MSTDFTYNNKLINSSGPFRPTEKDMPNDGRTRVNSYSDIANIPMPYIGMNITVKVDETNENKMTDYKVISLKANSLGVAGMLIDQVQRMDEYLGALTEVPAEYVTEQEMNEAIANVSSGGNVDLSGYATKDELNTKANISDIPTAIETYVTTHRDELKGETGSAGKDGVNAVNPNFTIGTVIELDKGNPPTVTISGTYPNLVLNFGIPTKEPTAVEYMYYGRLPVEDVGGRVIQYNEITESMILKGVTDGKLTKATPHTLGKTSLGLASTTAVGDYQIVIVPASNNYTVTKDNGLGGKMEFDEETSGANGIDIVINTIACKLYGEILIAQGEKFIYVD